MLTKNLPLDKLHVLCFMKKIVCPSLKTWNSKTTDFCHFWIFWPENCAKILCAKIYVIQRTLFGWTSHSLFHKNLLYLQTLWYGIKLKTARKCQLQIYRFEVVNFYFQFCRFSLSGLLTSKLIHIADKWAQGQNIILISSYFS